MNTNGAFDSPGPSSDLPMLTDPQAAYLRQLVAPYLRDGHHHSLHNLAHLCRQHPESRWPELVAAHFASLRQAGRGEESAEELLRGVHSRLLPIGTFTPEIAASMTYARVVADGLVFAFALDAPTSVRILTDHDVERAGLDELGRAAHANLLAVPVKHEEVSVAGRARLHSLHGDSPFIASKALFLAQVALEVTGESLPSAGALVIVPNRHLLAFHPITDGSVVDALNGLAEYALRAYEDGPGELSPRVYWWHEGALTSLTVIDEETRTFSLQPPPRLLGLMKGLVRLDRAGRIHTAAAAEAPDAAALTAATAESVRGLAEEPAGLADAFASALALAHVECVEDPKASGIAAWSAWEAALRLGSTLFTGSERPQDLYLGEDLVVPLPALPAAPSADARAWLDALYLAMVCRQKERTARLCRVPLETLRQDETVDEYVLHWIDTLQTYFSDEHSADDVVPKLLATIKTSMPEAVTRAPSDFVNRIDYHPVALFHRLLTADHEAFASALSDALSDHAGYWGAPGPARSHLALGALAMATMAHDNGFPFPLERAHLPLYLLNGERVEHLA
ncbi:immunity 49 family protein [Streptomyces sp. NPDC047014]|uniref:immunity 49 family protein n=1 Tax=Streptomyces sp. NPDC047014 TaxID=3155736 RepID=UPI0033D7FB17